jgi:hypothetical protein
MPAIESSPSTPLSAWQPGLQEVDPHLAAQLHESTDPYAVLAGMKLPIPRYVKFPTINAFLDDPDAALEPLDKVGITNFYVGGRTDAPELTNFRNPKDPLTRDEIVPFLTDESRVTADNRDKYVLRVAEFLKGVCLVMEIEPEGTVHIDIAEGTLPPLTSGGKQPDYIATNNHPMNPGRQLQYFDAFPVNAQGKPISIEDAKPLRPAEYHLLSTSIREQVWKGIKAIPAYKTEEGGPMSRLPGTYEAAIVEHHGIATIIFADAQLRISGRAARRLSLPYFDKPGGNTMPTNYEGKMAHISESVEGN